MEAWSLDQRDQDRFRVWLEVISSQSPLLTPAGSEIWIEGIEVLRALSLFTFKKRPDTRTSLELSGLALIDRVLDRSREFVVTGDALVATHSSIYAHTRELSRLRGVTYRFPNEITSDFEPWRRRVTLGQSFHTAVDGQIRIPFYTFHHENTHIVSFERFYSNIDVADEVLVRLWTLIEWYCISQDLLLAFDLQRAGARSSLLELTTAGHRNKESGESVFFQETNTLSRVNAMAGRFRSAFLDLAEDSRVEDMIALRTLERHVDYCGGLLLESCRRIDARVTRAEAERMIRLLETALLTDCVCAISGVRYEA